MKMGHMTREMLSALAEYMKFAMDNNEVDFLDFKGIHAIGQALGLDSYFRLNGGFDLKTNRHSAERIYEVLYNGMKRAKTWQKQNGYVTLNEVFPYEPFKEIWIDISEDGRKNWQRWLYLALEVYLMEAFGLDIMDKPLATALREFKCDIAEEIANDACLEDF